MSNCDFGKRLKTARKNTGWTQEQLGKNAKVPHWSIAQFETNARKPSFNNVRNLAIALKVSADYLLGIIDELTIVETEFSQKMKKISGNDRILLADFINLLIKRNNKQ
jgi:transcriptional regulator with XRE-family HTH domain